MCDDDGRDAYCGELVDVTVCPAPVPAPGEQTACTDENHHHGTGMYHTPVGT